MAAGSLVTAIGQELGQTIQLGSISGSLLDFIFGTTTRLDTGVNLAEGELQPGYSGGLAGRRSGNSRRC